MQGLGWWLTLKPLELDESEGYEAEQVRLIPLLFFMGTKSPQTVERRNIPSVYHALLCCSPRFYNLLHITGGPCLLLYSDL